MLSAFRDKKWSPVQFAGELTMNENKIERNLEYQSPSLVIASFKRVKHFLAQISLHVGGHSFLFFVCFLVAGLLYPQMIQL